LSATPFAYLFASVTLITVLFQFALAAGMPWGNLAMGGRYPGKFPPGMRVGAVIQAALLAFLAAIVLSNAGVAFPGLSTLSNLLIWVAVAISAISLVMNLITLSKWERILWAPVALVMMVSSLIVALS
jgi:lipoprotein signal peptidase